MTDLSPIRDRLDALGDAGRQIALWWRDDDAVAPTRQLEALLACANQFSVPLALAVIPAHAERALAAALANHDTVSVQQHGYSHANHAPTGSKKAELGPHRPVDDMLAELFDGYRRMSELFGPRFAHVLTPPWNRIAPELSARRKDVGLVGLSTFGPAPEGARAQVNTHLDPIEWRRGKRFSGDEACLASLIRELDRRLSGSDEPIGLLTHHLVQTEETWAFIEAFLGLMTDHPAVVWPSHDELFEL
ncbi:MAG: polysaccharide deacetylase family protein [Pseudomonadota bacterium]